MLTELDYDAAMPCSSPRRPGEPRHGVASATLFALLLALAAGCGAHVAQKPRVVAPAAPEVAVYGEDDPVPNDGIRTVVATGHSARVSAIAASADGRWIVSASEDGELKLREGASSREVATAWLADPAFEVAVDPHGVVVVMTQQWHAVRWAALEGKEPQPIAVEKVSGVTAAPNGQFALVGTTISLLAPDGAVRALPVRLDTDGPAAVRFVGDDELSVVLSDGSSTRVKSLSTRPVVTPIDARKLEDVVVSADGRVLAGRDAGGNVVVGPTDGGPLRAVAKANPDAMGLSPDGKTLFIALTAGDEERTDVVDVASGRVLRTLAKRGFTKIVGVDKRILAAADAHFCTVELASERLTCDHPAQAIRGLDVTPDGRALVVGAERTHAWPLDGVARIEKYGTVTDPKAAPVLSPDGELLVQPTSISTEVFRTSTRGSVKSIKGSVSCAIFAHDGTSVLVAHGPKVSLVPEAGVPRELFALEKGSVITNLGLRADGEQLVIQTSLRRQAGGLSLRRVGTGEAIDLVPSTPATIAALFAPEGPLLATAHADGNVRLWDTTARTLVRTLEVKDRVLALRFRGDGKLLATGTATGAVSLWDVATGKEERALRGSRAPVTAVAFLPNNRLAVGHQDGRVRLWNVHAARILGELSVTGAGEDAVVVGEDGRYESSNALEMPELYGVKDGEPVPWGAWAPSRRRGGVLAHAVSDAPPAAMVTAPEAVLQKWPREQVRSMTFDPSGTLLAATLEKETLVFDVVTGALASKIAGGNGAAFSPDGRALAVGEGLAITIAGRDGHVVGRWRASDTHPIAYVSERTVLTRGFAEMSLVEGGSVTLLSQFEPTDGSLLASYARAPQMIATAHEDQFSEKAQRTGRVQVWRLEAKRAALVHELRCSIRTLVEIALSPDGKRLACADISGLVVVVDVATGKRERWRPNPYASQDTIYGLAFHPTKPLLALATLSGLFIRDLGTGTVVHPGGAGRMDAVTFSPDGHLLAVATMIGDVEIWDTGTWQLTHALTSRTARVAHLAVDPRSTKLALTIAHGGSAGGRTIWDASTGRASSTAGSPHSEVAFSPKREGLVSIESPGLVATDGAGARTWTADPGSYRGVAFALQGEAVVTTVSRGTGPKETLGLVGIDAANGRTLWMAPAPSHSFHALAVSPDGSRVAFSSYDQSADGAHTTAHVVVLRAKDGQELATFSGFGDLSSAHDLAWTSDTQLAAAMGPDAIVRVFDTNTKTQVRTVTGFRDSSLALAAWPKTRTLAVTDGGGAICLFDTTSWKERAHSSTPRDDPRQLVFFGDGRGLARVSSDGTLRLLNLEVRSSALLVPVASGSAVLLTDDGSYLAPRDTAGALAFRWGERTYPFEQFDAIYNRPHVALGRLGFATADVRAAYADAYQRRLERLGTSGSPTAGAVPTVSVGAISSSTDRKKLTLVVSASDPKKKLRRIHVFDNGVPLFGSSGIELAARSASRVDESIEVELTAGPNKLQISAENENGVLSLEATALTAYVGPAPKPNLRVYAIGVTHYAKRDLDLTYPSIDAHAVAEAFCRRPAPGAACPPSATYASVEARELLDEQATRAGILSLRAELERTHPEDVVVFYISGHGVLDEKGTYFFAPHEIDPGAIASTGVSYASIDGLLDGIPARKKLLLMDSCNAGELEPGELAAMKLGGGVIAKRASAVGGQSDKLRATLVRDLFADLRRGTGTHVIASSGAAEYSFEDVQWKNSVFAYALLKGLRDREADADKSGELKVSALRSFVSRTVVALTEGHQTPNARQENLDADFDLTPDAPRKQPWSYDGCLRREEGTYACGVLTAAIVRVPPADDAFARFRVDVQKKISDPRVKVSWTTVPFAAGGKHYPGMRLEVRRTDFDDALAAGIVALVPGEKGGTMLVSCVVWDGIPSVMARCQRGLEAMVGKAPLDEFPR